MTDLIPRAPSRVPLVVSLLAVAILLGSGAVFYFHRSPSAPASPAAAFVAPPPTAPVQAPVPVPVPVPVPAGRPPSPAVTVAVAVTPTSKHHGHAKPTAPAVAPPSVAVTAADPPAATTPGPTTPSPPPPPAPPAKSHLTLTSDVQADVYIDGAYIRATPIVDHELPPGRHTIHLESAAPGLRLIPRDRTVDLKPGELKEVRMELK